MIEVKDIFREELVKLCHPRFKNKDDAFRRIAQYLYDAEVIDNVDAYVESLYEREAMGPTYMGNGIALPHGKSSSVKVTSMIMVQCANQFEYETMGESHEVNMIFMLAISDQSSADEYLKLLSSLARMLAYDDFINVLKRSDNYHDIIAAANDTMEKLADD